MKPAGYHVVPSSGSPMLVLDEQNAIDKAALRNGTCTGLFSISQVIAYLEDCDIEMDEAIAMLSELQA